MPVKPFTAAVVQWAPCVHDAVAGAEKAALAIAEAASKGARLVVFPELWLQGYPYWASDSMRDPGFQGFREAVFASGICLQGPEVGVIRAAAAEHACTVVMGAHERVGGSLYNTIFYIGSDGNLIGSHRKLMPTTSERLVHGMGDGSDLAVYETDVGKLSGLICFEHHMPLARYALCDLGVEVLASQWPGHAFLDTMIDAATRQFAMENASFVLVAREVFGPENIVEGMPAQRQSGAFGRTHGGSAIIAPGGHYIVEPVFDAETIITAEIDLGQIPFNKWWIDGTGHYSRPDVFQLVWDKRPKPAVRIIEAEGDAP